MAASVYSETGTALAPHALQIVMPRAQKSSVVKARMLPAP